MLKEDSIDYVDKLRKSWKEQPKLSTETVEARERIKKGKFLTEEKAEKRLSSKNMFN